jgi:hypothetical protein
MESFYLDSSESKPKFLEVWEKACKEMLDKISVENKL